MTPSAAAPLFARDSLRRAFDLYVSKARTNITALADQPAAWALAPDGRYPRWHEHFFDIGNWTSSFFTGMALLAWRETGDGHYLREVERLEPWYRAKVGEHAMDTMHDLGFLYTLHSVALHKLTGEARHRELGLRAAEVLAGRFIPQGNYLRAWGRMDRPDTDHAGLAIIDTLMNLPLLYWASRESGDPRYREIAIRHSDTTLRCFIRPDDSLYHCYRFDLADGSPLRGENYGGRDLDSHWARGNSWAIYGFALGFRHTADARYLDASQRLARRFVSLLDAGMDFRPDRGAPQIRDSSAAAVAVCGFQELELAGAAGSDITAAKQALLGKLCSDAYLDFDPGIEGVLRHGEVGDGAHNARSAYTSWGDYFLMEALARELGTRETWW